MQWRISNFLHGMWLAANVFLTLLGAQNSPEDQQQGMAMRAEVQQARETEKEFRTSLAQEGICFHNTLLVKDASAWHRLGEEPRVIELPPRVEKAVPEDKPMPLKNWAFPQLVEAQ